MSFNLNLAKQAQEVISSVTLNQLSLHPLCPCFMDVVYLLQDFRVTQEIVEVEPVEPTQMRI